MNIHKRFIIQFFIQLILVFFILFFLLLTTITILGYFISRDEITQDLSKADSQFFSNRMTIQDEKVTFDNELKQLAKNQNGWFLVLTAKGKVIGSYNTPKPVPAHYKESELTALMLQNTSGHEKYTHWKLDETNPQSNILLFGRNNSQIRLLNEIMSDVDWKKHHLSLSPATLQQIDLENGWVQLINSTGKVVDQYGTDKEPLTYSINDLLTLTEDAHHEVTAYFDTGTAQTIIVGIYDSSSDQNLNESLFKKISNSILIIFIMLFLLLLSGAFWYAHKFGVPLITLMKWIQNLGNDLYEQPLDLHQRPIILNKHGKLRRKYWLYKEMIATLSKLTETLKENEEQRRKMTQTREEWITGLSHDLKTPLASISGYAQMLETENYSWTEAESKEFAGIIVEKSTYMKELLEDLTLTYRLKNQALPIIKEQVDINDFIRQMIIQCINNPINKDKNFTFQPYPGPAFISIDPKWFQRIMDNLIANAIKYNPPGTTITVTILPIEQHLIIIKVEDDGVGMDNETLGNLFNRYYRGTNTSESSSGTGLGMAITKQLVHLHGGSISVTSIEEKGTTVRIILPVE